MAHYVVCAICKERFDRDKFAAVLVSPRRYAHASCANKLPPEEAKKEKDLKELEDYIIKLFNLDHMDGRITLQIKKYMQDYPNYTYSGIKNTLYYFYEIKKNSIDKANGSIGIVPWVYEEAYRYFYNQWLLSQKNADKDIELYKPKVRDIVIKPPKREIKKRRLFMFLDEEEENAQ